MSDGVGRMRAVWQVEWTAAMILCGGNLICLFVGVSVLITLGRDNFVLVRW